MSSLPGLFTDTKVVHVTPGSPDGCQSSARGSLVRRALVGRPCGLCRMVFIRFSLLSGQQMGRTTTQDPPPQIWMGTLADGWTGVQKGELTGREGREGREGHGTRGHENAGTDLFFSGQKKKRRVFFSSTILFLRTEHEKQGPFFFFLSSFSFELPNFPLHYSSISVLNIQHTSPYPLPLTPPLKHRCSGRLNTVREVKLWVTAGITGAVGHLTIVW